MNLRRHRFEIPENRKIERDPDGQFYLNDSTGQRKMLVRDEAREYLKHNVLIDSQQEDPFTHVSIGEQWIGHRELFEFGENFIRMGRNELARDWKKTFGLSLPENHRSTAYNFLHGLELGLKAYLLFEDERLLPIDLKSNYGHNLRKLLADAKSNGLEIKRCVVVPYDDQAEEDDDILGSYPDNNWLGKLLGKASNEEERRFDIAVGINLERYASKGTEYPISIYEGQEHYYLVSIASMAYTLFNEIRNSEGFFEPRRGELHGEFDTWLRELHIQRKNFILSEDEATEKLSELNALFDKCDSLPGPDSEPDWEDQVELINQSKERGATNT